MFDPDEEVAVVERKLPHWTQPGTICFITFRTYDSMPAQLIERWHAERGEWLRRHGIDPPFDNLSERLNQTNPSLGGSFARIFSKRWHDKLDECHGDCVLRESALAKFVADSLLHFDGERYIITDFVVMPNHVHLLAAFVSEDGMLAQCDSWKHYTARQINLKRGTKGRFWQQDGFDHLVRTIEHFDAFRRYIAANPKKSNLKIGEYMHYSKKL